MVSDAHPRPPFMQQVGHRFSPAAPWLSLAVGAWNIIQDAVPDTALMRALDTLFLLTFYGALFCSITAHGGKLCELCITAIPLDAAERAARKRRWLRLFHHSSRALWLGRLPFPIVLVGVAAACLAVAYGLGYLLDADALGQSALSAVFFFTPMAALLNAQDQHSRYRPWCPYCRPPGGGDPVTEPTPDPSLCR